MYLFSKPWKVQHLVTYTAQCTTTAPTIIWCVIHFSFVFCFGFSPFRQRNKKNKMHSIRLGRPMNECGQHNQPARYRKLNKTNFIYNMLSLVGPLSMNTTICSEAKRWTKCVRAQCVAPVAWR